MILAPLHAQSILLLNAAFATSFPHETSSSLGLIRACKHGVPDGNDAVDHPAGHSSEPNCSPFKCPGEAESVHRVIVIFSIEMGLGAPLHRDESEGNSHDEAGERGSGDPVLVNAMITVEVIAAELQSSQSKCPGNARGTGRDGRNSRREIDIGLVPTPTASFTVTVSIRPERLRQHNVRQPDCVPHIHRCQD